jgi:Tol biopolymer transport system component
MLKVDEGKPTGAPTLLKEMDKDFTPLGFSSDGSFYYGDKVGRDSNNIYVATVDFETGKVLVPETRVSLLSYYNNAQRWSHDGKYLAYASRGPSSPNGTHLAIWSLETGEERVLKLKSMRNTILEDWSPDGRSILFREDGRKISLGLHQVDVETGDITTTTEYPNAPGQILRFLKNGKQIYYVRDQSVIVTFDLETHEEKELYRSKTTILRCSWPSPDRRRLAIVESESLAAEQPAVVRTISTSDGEPSKSLYAAELTWGGAPKWTPDGDIIVIERPHNEPDAPDKVWIIPVEGGDARESELGIELNGFVLNPDGQHIAFARRERERESQIWVLENFLPDSTAGR